MEEQSLPVTPQESLAVVAQPVTEPTQSESQMEQLKKNIDLNTLKLIIQQAQKDYREHKNYTKKFSANGRFRLGSDKNKWIYYRVMQLLVEHNNGGK